MKRGRVAGETGSAEEPMPFAIDLLAGIELLLSIGAFGFLVIAAVARRAGETTVPVLPDIYPSAFREPAPTVIALLAGPPILVAIGLILRRPWGRFLAILLHASLGACALWHFALRLSPSRDKAVSSADVTILMFLLFWLSIGVPLFLNRRHMRAAFARGRR